MAVRTCLKCKNCFACSSYLIDLDDLDKPILKKDIQDIYKVMGGFRRKEDKWKRILIQK